MNKQVYSHHHHHIQNIWAFMYTENTRIVALLHRVSMLYRHKIHLDMLLYIAPRMPPKNAVCSYLPHQTSSSARVIIA